MRFEKISYKQYCKDFNETLVTLAQKHYEEIKLPRRATRASAGYDIFATEDINLAPGETIKVPTGIRVILDEDKFLLIVPRSGLGFKYKLQFDNTVGIIDADYSQSDNEGHFWVKMTNEGAKPLHIEKGQAIAQGIIVQYFKVDSDDADGIRNGGFGSTT